MFNWIYKTVNKTTTCGVPDWLCEWLGTEKHLTQEVVLRFSNREFATATAKVITRGVESVKHFIIGMPVTPSQAEEKP